MADHELVLTGVLLASAAFLVIAYLTRLPYPLWLVVGGAVMAFLPALPDATLKPDLVLVLLLPPLLYAAAFFSSVRDLRANVRPISLLAFGLVLFTMVGIAVLGHFVIDLSWPVAFVLGAVLSPTDPVATTAIGRRVGAPPRVITIVEGESLVNDSTTLVAYKFAIAAVVTGGFSAWDAGLDFAVDVVAGVAIGLVVAWLVSQLTRRIDDAPTEIVISLLTPFFAYLPSEHLGVSAVLAAVSAGLYMGWNAPRLLTPSTRIQAYAVWEIVTFAINALLFMLVGLSLPGVLDGISGTPVWSLVRNTVVVAGGVIVIRFIWVFGLWGLARARPWLRRGAPDGNWRGVTLIAYNGMRGAVSLATALAIPLTIEGGAPFPDRDLLVFLVYMTIMVTLLGQGLSLPWLIRRLGLAGAGAEHEAAAAARTRLAALDAALDRAEELREEGWVPPELLERLRRSFELRRDRLARRDDPGVAEEPTTAGERDDLYARVRRDLQDAQRERILELRNEGRINDETMRRIERELDLEDARLERLA